MSNQIKNLFIAIITVFTAQTTLHSQGIQFAEGSWADIVQLAKAENKPIVVDAYATWCGPCKWMAKTTFTDKKVGEFINDNYVAYKMDMEKGEGIEFAKKNKVMAYPTILFFNSNGELIHKGVGALGPKPFITLCEDALDPTKQLITLENRFGDGDRDPKFIKNYLDASMAAVNIDTEAFEFYWNSLNEKERLSEATVEMMAAASNNFGDYKSLYFKYFSAHKTDYINSIGENQFNAYINTGYKYAMRNLYSMDNEEAAKNELPKVKEAYPYFADEAEMYFAYLVNARNEDENARMEALNNFLAVTKDYQMLNSHAWSMYENSLNDDTVDLTRALELVTRSVELNANFNNLDTKARILVAMDKNEEAVNVIDLAIKAGKKEKPKADTTELEELKNSILQ